MLLLMACSGSRVELLVDLRTDLVPGQEFVRVVSVLTPTGGSSPYDEALSVDADFPAFEGSRVAEFPKLQEGPYQLRVRLEDKDGAFLIERQLDLALREDFAVTVVITRSCRNVTCDDPERAACLGGVCVSASCSPETDEQCGPAACGESLDCTAPSASCAEAACISGTCFFRGREDACAESAYCNPDSGCRLGPPGTLASAEIMPGSNGDERALDVAALPAGGAAVVGRFAGITTSGEESVGGDDAFVALMQADGAPREVHTLGGLEDDAAQAVAVDDAGNLYVGGRFRSSVDFGGGPFDSAGRHDLFVASYTPAGVHRWSSRRGGAEEEDVGDMVICSDQLYVVGQFGGSWDPGSGTLMSAGMDDAFVARYALDGTQSWLQRLGGTGDDAATAVTCDGAGGVLVSGTFSGTVDLGGSSATTSGGTDVFVMNFAPDGTPVFVNHFGGGAEDRSTAIARDASGNIYVGGSYVADIDFGGASHGPRPGQGGYVVSFSSTGDYRWHQSIGSSTRDFVEALALDADENVVVAGGFSGSMDLGGGLLPHVDQSDIFVASYDNDGIHRWSRAYGGAGSDAGWGLSIDPSDPMVQVAGFFSGTVDFPTGPKTSVGGADSVLLLLVP